MPRQCRKKVFMRVMAEMKPAKELATPSNKVRPCFAPRLRSRPTQAPVFLRRLPGHAYIVGAFLLL